MDTAKGEPAVTPMSDAEAAILGKLADIAQQQAVTSERLIGVLERLDDHLSRMDTERERAVHGLKGHIDSSMKKAFFTALAILMLADIAGAALTKFMPFLKP